MNAREARSHLYNDVKDYLLVIAKRTIAAEDNYVEWAWKRIVDDIRQLAEACKGEAKA